MSAPVVIFVREWHMDGDLEEVKALLEHESIIRRSVYVVVAGSSDRDKTRERVNRQVPTTRAEGRQVFPARELSKVVDDGPAHAKLIADYIREILWNSKKNHMDGLEVVWHRNWAALWMAGAAVMSFVPGIRWNILPGSPTLPDFSLHKDLVIEAAMRSKPAAAGRTIDKLIGNSEEMSSLRGSLLTNARLPYPVLLIGETGTGKELCANVLHEDGGRKGELISVNAATLHSDRFAESMLFGHKRNAYTGADVEFDGRIKEAKNGTFFLDEVDSLSVVTQARLLRALNRVDRAEIHVTPLGGADKDKSDVPVRLISATHESPFEDPDFRQDFFFRIATIQIHIPPLRDRGDDVIQIATEYLQTLNDEWSTSIHLHVDTHEPLRAHRWPGNVRELQHVVLLCFLQAKDSKQRTIRIDQMTTHLPKPNKKPRFDGVGTLEMQIVRYRIAAADFAIARNPGSLLAAAKELGFKNKQDFMRMLERERSRLSSLEGG